MNPMVQNGKEVIPIVLGKVNPLHNIIERDNVRFILWGILVLALFLHYNGDNTSDVPHWLWEFR